MKYNFKHIFPAAAMLLTLGFSSCADDLDVTPLDKNQQYAETVGAAAALNKCYANMAVAGNGGANGDTDIDGLDGGTTGFVRQLFNANTLTTDEAICGWGDDGIAQFDYIQYDASHPMLRGFFNRLYVGIAYCNQYLSDFEGQNAQYDAEARFLRALYYYELLDGWGNVPFTTAIGSELPEQIQRADLYAWIEQELLDVIDILPAGQVVNEGTDGYGRANKNTAQLLLARLYLNAEVYTGTAQWAKAKEYAQSVINSAYKLHTTSKNANWSAYQELFMGDNGKNGAAEESLLSVVQDGQRTTSWGTTLFLMAGSMDNSEVVNKNGTTGNNTTEGWAGNRTRPDLIAKFFPNNDAPQVSAADMPDAAGDARALFHGEGRNLENTAVGTFTDGFAVCKFNNWTTDGSATGSTQFPDADFFLFRVAEAYLIAAEADARSNNGATSAEGTGYLNTLRARANASQRAGYSLSDICDEWSREFYFEGMRRPTLIRFGRYAGSVNYNWAWKGGVQAGRNVDSHYNLFAIPYQELDANKNLTQNPGY